MPSANILTTTWHTLTIPSTTSLDDVGNPDGQTWASALAILRSQEGWMHTHRARQVEHPDKVWLVVTWRTALQFHTFQHSTAFASFWDPLTSLAASPPTWHHVQPVDGTLGGPIMTRASHGVEPYTEVLTLFFPEDLSAVGKNKVRSVCGFPMIGGLGVEGERALLGTNRGWWDDGQVTSDAEAGQGEERKELGRGKGGKAKRKPAKDADAGKGELTEWKGEKVRAFVYVFSWRSAEKERVFKETETWWSVARGEMRPILEVFFEEFEAAGLLGWESLHGYF